MSFSIEDKVVLEKTRPADDRGSKLARLRRLAKGDGPATFYGLLAVLTVAVVQFFFSLEDGAFYVTQWYRGAIAISVLLVVSTLVPGYLTRAPIGRKQWMLAGALGVLLAVVGLSILWSLSRELSFFEASRTTMYVGAFVLLLPAAARWGWLVVDTVIFGGLLIPALYGLLQKIFPTVMEYTGFISLEQDPRASSTVGYHPTFGMMCAMGALLCVSRVGSFRATSLRLMPLRAIHSAVGTLFLVALFFTFSRGAILALAGGALVLVVLSKRRFEVLGNALVSGLPALWVISQARELPGLVARPVSLQVMANDGWELVGPLSQGILLAFVAQVVFTLVVLLVEKTVPRRALRVAGVVGGVAAAAVVVVGLAWGVSAFQASGGIEEVRREVSAASVADTTDSDELSRDQSERYTSLHAGDRILLWQIAWDNWKQHPVTGTGGDTYRLVYQQEKPQEAGEALHPHSMWMSLLSDTGIVAFLAFAAFSVGLFVVAAQNALRRGRSRHSRAIIAGAAAAAAAYLISSSIDWNWYIPASTLPFFALAAVAAVMTPRRERNKSPDVAP